jgi:small subunit ribosomal protein S8e
MQWNVRKGRKVTGGKYNKRSKKFKYQRGRDFVPTRIGARKIKVLRTRGGNTKALAIKVDMANVVVGKGKIQKAKIIQVKDNKANAQYIRSNIITKGCKIETDLGFAIVTSRPGQDGSVDAVLVEPKK